VFDYSVPTVTPDGRNTFAEISTSACAFSKQYVNRASKIASTTQAFDVLTLAGGIGTVFATIFRASSREIEALSAGTAASYAGGSYYATRARALAYFNGATAMQCIASLSDQANLLFTDNTGGPNLSNVRAVYKNTDDTSKPTLYPLIDFTSNGPILLSSAMDSVNGKILSANISASTAPDISTLRTTMLSQVQDAVTKQQAFTAAANNQTPGRQPKIAGSTTPVTIDDIRPQIDFVATFASAVTACIAKAG
jgi:hypothetical protein